jgi:hypothetical protein
MIMSELIRRIVERHPQATSRSTSYANFAGKTLTRLRLRPTRYIPGDRNEDARGSDRDPEVHGRSRAVVI